MEIWHKLIDKGYSYIEEMCDEKMIEGQQLEFKQKSNPASSELDKPDKKGIGETLSAMSNATGGVLLFGIVCKKEDESDYAEYAQEINDVKVVASKIESLIMEYISPANNDIEVLAIERPEERSGVVAIKIGISDMRPHMSLAPSHQKYFIRTLAQNKPMMDFQIRDLLRIKTTAQLGLNYSYVRHAGSSTDFDYIAVIIAIKNVGEVTAQQPYIIVENNCNHLRCKAIEETVFVELPIHDFKGCKLYQGKEIPLHPGISIKALRILFPFKREGQQSDTMLGIPHEGHFKPAYDCSLELKFRVGCENSSAISFCLSIGGNELEEIADNFYLGYKSTSDGKLENLQKISEY